MKLPACALVPFLVAVARAGDVAADPSNHRARLATLRAGDTLLLAPGAYVRLPITRLAGRAGAWITIRGPEEGAPAVIESEPGHNTIELVDACFVALEHLVVDGAKASDAFGVSAKGGGSNRVHDVHIEGCTFRNFSAAQQQVAISTKTPTWNWTIRGNRILDAGTGVYLGNSDGTDPFVAGVIEGNLVQNTLGYAMQIKWQRARPEIEGLPTGASVTVIRDNVFAKDGRASPDGDRPSVLVGGLPERGAGAEDRYEIARNLLLGNPREALLQASGRVSVHDNVFVGDGPVAIHLGDHDRPLLRADVGFNTVYGPRSGIRFEHRPRETSVVTGNLVFAATPITGAEGFELANVVASLADATQYVVRPSLVPGAMDFHPLAGRCVGKELDPAPFGHGAPLPDFDGRARADHRWRGAYAGPASANAFQLDLRLKPLGPASR
ncbi:MAG: right-handed parallel beta-helix repeat-containing protein [Planctomycetes bacterium]|nr:right-handed parallel beta-helix repeat-containing protein [Planctomycetota bacterium]